MGILPCPQAWRPSIDRSGPSGCYERPIVLVAPMTKPSRIRLLGVFPDASCGAFYFRPCRNYFCLLYHRPSSCPHSHFGHSTFRIHFTRDLGPFPALCQSSNHFPLDPDTLHLELTNKDDLHLHSHALPRSCSMAIASTWGTSCPESIPPTSS